MPALTGSQFQQLQRALLSAFPARADLARMVRHGLDENLDEIATGNLNNMVFELIQWAEARGNLERLVRAAYTDNPNNQPLNTFASALGMVLTPPTSDAHPIPVPANHATATPASATAGTETDEATEGDPLTDFNAIGENQHSLRSLVEQLESAGRSNLLPFIGAGVSIPFGFASWSAFLLGQGRMAGIEDQIRARLDAGEYEEAAQDLLDRRQPFAFHNAIGNEYGEHKLKGVSLQGAVTYLPALAPGPILTTNFDRLLETVFERSGKPFAEKVWGARYADVAAEALRRGERVLLKLHGDVRDSTDRILTRTDYDTHYTTPSGSTIDFSKPLPKLLQQVLIGRTLLFIGCSLKGDRTVTVLQQIAANFPSTAHYAIVEQPATSNEFHERDRFLAQHNIRPLWYPTHRHDYIEHILAHLASTANPH